MKTLALGAVLVAALGGVSEMTQRVWTSSAKVTAQTADSAVLVAKCWTTGADSVRVVWAYPGVSRAVTVRPSSCVDTLRVAKGAAAQTASVTLTPKRGAVSGAVKSLTVSVSARPVVVAPPTVDSAKVDTEGSVVTPPVVVPPAVDTGFTAHRPAHIALAGDVRFGPTLTAATEGLRWENWSAPNNGFGALLADPTGGASGTHVFQQYYPGNNAGNGYGGSLLEEPQGKRYTQLYVAISVYVPTDYVIHTNGEKFLYLRNNCSGCSQSSSIINWVPWGDGETATSDTWSLYHWDVTTQPNGPNRLTKGRWNRVEMWLKANTPGNADGELTAWINGVLAWHKTGISWRASSSQVYWEGLRFDGTRGGGTSRVLTPAAGQSRFYGRVAWGGVP